MSETSPGPWHALVANRPFPDPAVDYRVYAQDGELVAFVRSRPGFDAHAHAALIASAPTLRDDLGRAVEALRSCHRPKLCDVEGCKGCSLLAKLEGGR